MLKLSVDAKKTFWAVTLATVISVSPSIGFAAEVPPDAGRILQEMKRPKVDLPKKKAVDIKVEEGARPALQMDAGIKIAVKGFRITGDLLFSEADLQKLVEEGKGKEASLADLEKLTDKLTALYQSSGFLVARAYLPAQKIENGMVEIAIIAGKYDRIILKNSTVVKDDAIRMQLGQVRSGSYIEKKSLERALWLIGDLSGAEAKATLAPGATTGTSDLILAILPKGVRVSGNISVDNYGNNSTGKNEISANITILNPVSKGDALAVNFITTGKGVTNGAVRYALPISRGGRLELSYSHMNYELLGNFSSLNSTGLADTAGLNYTFNLIRSRKANLSGQIGFMNKRLTDNVATISSPKQSQLWTVGLLGDSLDNFGGGGANSYSAIFSSGQLNYENQSASITDSYYANATGAFGKGNFSAARQQYLNDRLSLLLFFNAQLATKNLDSAEKMTLGGAYGIRAYPNGTAFGDQGYMLNSELRWMIPLPEKKGLLQLVGFYDLGGVTINKNPWPGAGDLNQINLQGTGLGLIWNDPGKTMVRMHYAWKVGSVASNAVTESANGLFWLQITKYF